MSYGTESFAASTVRRLAMAGEVEAVLKAFDYQREHYVERLAGLNDRCQQIHDAAEAKVVAIVALGAWVEVPTMWADAEMCRYCGAYKGEVYPEGKPPQVRQEPHQPDCVWLRFFEDIDAPADDGVPWKD